MLMTAKGTLGTTYYFFAFDASDAIWQTTTSAYVTKVADNYANYKIGEGVADEFGDFSATAPDGMARYEARQSVGTLATDNIVATGEPDLSAITDTLATIGGQVGDCQGRLSTLQGTANTINGKADALAGDIAALSIGGGTGGGIYPIDHNGGTGLLAADVTIYSPYTNPSGVGSSADVMRFTNGSAGVAGLTIRAYLATDYDSNVRGVLATTYSGSDGRWISPLNLNSGTYYVIGDTPGDGYVANQIKLTIP